MDETSDIGDIIETQYEINNGVAVVSVEDGSVFVFSTEILERLLEKSRESGKVIIFVKRQTAS